MRPGTRGHCLTLDATLPGRNGRSCPSACTSSFGHRTGMSTLRRQTAAVPSAHRTEAAQSTWVTPASSDDAVGEGRRPSDEQENRHASQAQRADQEPGRGARHAPRVGFCRPEHAVVTALEVWRDQALSPPTTTGDPALLASAVSITARHFPETLAQNCPSRSYAYT